MNHKIFSDFWPMRHSILKTSLAETCVIWVSLTVGHCGIILSVSMCFHFFADTNTMILQCLSFQQENMKDDIIKHRFSEQMVSPPWA